MINQSYGTGNGSLLIKLDDEGNKLWGFGYTGSVYGCAITAAVIYDDFVLLSVWALEGWVEIQNNRYENDTRGTFLIKLDAKTGEVIEHFAYEETNSQFQYIESLTENKFRVLLSMRDIVHFENISLGVEDSRVNYFADVDFDFLTRIKELSSDVDVNIYPNPVPSGGVIHVQLENSSYQEYTLYNVSGQLVQRGSLDQQEGINSIVLSNVNTSGMHYLILQDEESNQSLHNIMISQ